MKEPGHFIVQNDLTERDMREVVMQDSESYSTREATERLLEYSILPMQSRTLIRLLRLQFG